MLGSSYLCMVLTFIVLLQGSGTLSLSHGSHIKRMKRHEHHTHHHTVPSIPDTNINSKGLPPASTDLQMTAAVHTRAEHGDTLNITLKPSYLIPNGIKAGIAGGDAYMFMQDHIGWWYDWSVIAMCRFGPTK
jgi:hypothetical protein